MRSGPFTDDSYANHYSLLRTIEDALGLPSLTDNDTYAQPPERPLDDIADEPWHHTRHSLRTPREIPTDPIYITPVVGG